MFKKQIPDKNSFQEVGLSTLIETIGTDLFEQTINDLILKSYEEENKKSISSVDVGILYDAGTKEFQIWNCQTEEFLIQITFNKNLQFFCKPIKLLLARASKIVKEAGKERMKGALSKANIFNELFLYYDLIGKEHLNDYLLCLTIILLDEYNFDFEKSTVLYYNEDSLILNGIKTEYIDTNLTEEEADYTISISTLEDQITIVRIGKINIAPVLNKINLKEFFMNL